MRTRSVFGEVVLPPDAPRVAARVIHVEVRDVTVADAPSLVVAARDLRDVTLSPGAHVPFSLEVPEADASRSLGLRVHVDIAEAGRVSSGDLLTTQAIDVPASGEFGPVRVVVRRV